MRKIFTLLTMCLLASTAWAATIVFDATVDVGDGSSTAGEFTIVKDGITVHVEQGVANGTHYRFYKNKKVTITSAIGNMTNIVFDCVGANDEQYGSGGFTAEPGVYEPKGKEGVWTNPGVTQVVFTATNFQVRATKITVTVNGDVGLMAPSISPASGTYYESLTVNMSCMTDGAKIYYTTNGSTPTASSTQYTAPFTIPFELGKTVTVKAVSVKDGETSDMTTATYKFEEAPKFGWADMFNVADNTNVTFSYPSIVLWQSGQNMYVKDETGYGLVYQCSQVYQIGDIIPEGFSGVKATYMTMPELKSPKNFQPATTYIEEVEPDVIAPNQVDEAHWAHYVRLNNVKVTPTSNTGGTLTDANGNSCTYFTTTFGVPAPEDAANHDVWGIVAAYKPSGGDLVFQILPISFDEKPKREPPTDVVSIEELYELNRGKWGHFTTPLTTIYQNGLYLYVKDNEGTYGLAYGNVAYNDFANGDIINDAIAAWTLYGGNKQMTPNGQTFVKAGHGDRVEPEIMAIDEVMTDMIYWYLGFENVTITKEEAEFTYTMTDETGSMKLYDKNFKAIPEVLPTGTCYVEGFLTVYNNELEFYPTRVGKKGDVNGDGEVNIADVNCLIKVILGQVNADIYQGRADVNEDLEVNIADVNAVIAIILAS